LLDPKADLRFEALKAQAEQARGDNWYVMFVCWRLFFECPWEVRGMNTLVMDNYQYW